MRAARSRRPRTCRAPGRWRRTRRRRPSRCHRRRRPLLFPPPRLLPQRKSFPRRRRRRRRRCRCSSSSSSSLLLLRLPSPSPSSPRALEVRFRPSHVPLNRLPDLRIHDVGFHLVVGEQAKNLIEAADVSAVRGEAALERRRRRARRRRRRSCCCCCWSRRISTAAYAAAAAGALPSQGGEVGAHALDLLGQPWDLFFFFWRGGEKMKR